MATATRTNFRHEWHSLVRGWRNRYVRIKNITDTARHFEYLGNAGVTIPAGATVEVRLRRPVSYNKAVQYHNMMEADYNGVIEDVPEGT